MHRPNMEVGLLPRSQDKNADWGPGLALSDGVAEKGLRSIDVTFLKL